MEQNGPSGQRCAAGLDHRWKFAFVLLAAAVCLLDELVKTEFSLAMLFRGYFDRGDL